MAIDEPSTKPAHATEGETTRLDVITLLTRDHMHIEAMLNDYQRAANEAQRRELLRQIRHEVEVHEAAEEMAFYPRIKDLIPMGDILTSRRLEEQEEGRMLMQALDGKSPGEPSFEAVMHELIKGILLHAEEEEKEIFPRVLKALHAPDLLAMAADWEAAKAAAESSQG